MLFNQTFFVQYKLNQVTRMKILTSLKSFGWFVVFIATVLVGLWCLSPRFWLVWGVYRHGFGWFVVFIATVLVSLWCLSPRFWLVCGVYRHPKPWR
jgi:hypothetical protein